MTYSYDVIILGAGSAGLRAAKVCKKNGFKYLLIEKGKGGTLCASKGCMPSKALIEAANIYHTHDKFKDFHISAASQINIDIPAILQDVRDMRDEFVEGVIEGMQEHPVLHGAAKFLDAHTVRVGDKEYSAKNIIICTGSKPRIPDIFKDLEDQILTTDSLFEQDDLPDSMAVIGMGSIGAEMGQALARLGIKISAFQTSDSVMGITDKNINQKAIELLKKDMQLHMNVDIEKCTFSDNRYTLSTEHETIGVSGILVCAGRVSNLEGLGLENLDIDLSDDGVPDFDKETLKIKGHSIYVAGDANDYKSLLHEAAHEGTVAAQHALGVETSKRHTPLAITFTHPSYAAVGNTDCDDETDTTGAASYDNQARARMKGENFGLVKIHAARESGVLSGAEILAPAGEHLAHFLYLAIENEMRAQDLLDLPFYHPTLEEGLRPALKDIVK